MSCSHHHVPHHRQHQHQHQHRQHRRLYTLSALPNSGHLSDEVYRRIRQVDQQNSTLTAQGVKGFSARVLDTKDYRINKASADVSVVQLIEIIKKPGQSLGLYLREGNGVDRFTGVFASRFGENSELERSYGDIIRPGDEILSVNNVDVAGMLIDDVVLMLSIPRRLLLRMKYQRDRRDMLNHSATVGGGSCSGGGQQRCSSDRPVVVFQKSDAESRRESSRTGSSFLSKSANTASSWLGRRVRQQKQEEEQPPPPPIRNSHQHHQPTGPNAQVRTHQPRLIDARSGEPIPPYSQPPPTSNPHGYPSSPHMYSSRHSAYVASPPTLTNRPYATRPVVTSSSSVVAGLGRRPITSTGYDYEATQPAPNPYPPLYQQQQQSIGEAGGGAGYGAREDYARDYPGTAAASGDDASQYRSNSLSRRRGLDASLSATLPSQPPRSVKWRNDVIGPPTMTPPMPPAYGRHYPSPLLGAANASPQQHYYAPSRAYSDVESPSYVRPWERMNGGLRKMAAGGGRTIADIFSAQEYRNWAAPSRSHHHPVVHRYAGGTSSSQSEVGVAGHPHPYSRSTTDHANYYPPEHHRSRWTDSLYRPRLGGDGSSMRSNSLPSRALLANLYSNSQQAPPLPMQPATRPLPPAFYHASANSASDLMMPGKGLPGPGQLGERPSDVLDRLHISPLTNRRVPLRAAGSGFDVDRLSINALYGILSVSIVEGKSLRVPDRVHSKQLYVVLEINEVHRARTGISTPEQHFRWDERFEIDVHAATDAQFFIYSWHPQLRHRFCHKGSMRLLDAFFIDQLSGNRLFALNLEPRGQLIIKLGFADMVQTFRRLPSPNLDTAVFGVTLEKLLEREKKDTPIALARLLKEIEERGVDTPGLYSRGEPVSNSIKGDWDNLVDSVCGAAERKNLLKRSLDRDSKHADLTMGPVPDINLLACAVKDFLRELPKPLIPAKIYKILCDAASVVPQSDKEGNQKFIMRIVDCLPSASKSTLILLMDHLRNVLASEPHNGLNGGRVSTIFGPLLLCSNEQVGPCMAMQSAYGAMSSREVSAEGGYTGAVKVNPLDPEQASKVFKLLVDLWPSRVNSSDSNTSGSSTPGGGGGVGGNKPAEAGNAGDKSTSEAAKSGDIAQK